MCILFIKLMKAAKQGDFKLILASNRDEFFKRPSKGAHFWEEDGNIFGGRDMTQNKEGGTWLAMSKKGRIGVLLNASGKSSPQKLGRGFLVADFLKTPSSDTEYIETLQQNNQEYNPFHLMTAVLDPQPQILHYTSSTNKVTEINNETFGIGNSSIDKPFQKVVKGKDRFQEICKEFGKTELKDKLLTELLSLLKWEERHYPDEVIDSLSHIPDTFKSSYSAVFVKSPNFEYGTRTHTVILVDWENKVEFHEWTLKDPITPDHMEWNETHEHFTIET